MKLSSIHGRKAVNYLLKEGKVYKGKTMVIRYLPRASRHPLINPKDPGLYVGTLASSRLSKSAVKRNRMRRRCREAFRKSVQNMQEIGPVMLLIAPRSSSLHCDSGDIQDDVDRFLSFL